MHAPRFLRVGPLLIGFVLAALLLPAQLRANPNLLEDDARRAESLLALLQRQLTEAEQHYQSVIQPLRGPAAPGDQPAEFLTKARKGWQGQVADLAAVRARYAQPNANLAAAVQTCGQISHKTLGLAFQLALDLAGAHVVALEFKQRGAASANRKEHGDKFTAIEARKLDRAASTAATTELLAEYTQREQRAVEQLRKDYDAVIERMLATRRTLCGEMWMLADFQLKRGRQAAARAQQVSVYTTFETRLKERGPEFLRRWFARGEAPETQLDFFVAFPGSPDRLVVVTAFYKVPDSNLWKMDAAIRREPVESLRQFETLAPQQEVGSNLEQLCRMLARRLRELEQAKRQHAQKFAALQSAAAAPDAEAEIPDLAPLRAEMARLAEVRSDFDKNKRAFTEARTAVDRAGAAIEAAEREERAARSALKLDPKKLQPAAPADPQGESGEALLAEAKKQLRDAQVLADRLAPNDPQLKAMKETTLPRLQEKVASVQRAIDTGVAAKVRAVANARAAKEQAQAAFGRMTDPGSVESLRQAWAALRSRYEAMAGPARALGVTVAPFPDELGAEAAKRCAQTLADLASRQAAARNDRRWSATETLGDLRQADSDLRQIAASVAALRSAGADQAEVTISELGAMPNDPVLVELNRLKIATKETKEFFESYDKELEKFGEYLDKITKNAKAKGLLKTTREYVALIQKTFGKVSELIAFGLKLKEIEDQLSDERTVLQGIGNLLELVKDVAKYVPVVGPLLAEALTYYGSIAKACGEAAVAIQGKLIEQDLRTSFTNPAPERHLYIADDLANLRVGNENARARVLKMLQVRRLIALIGSAEASVVGDR